ncbi:MAG: TonB-dependent receptor [Alistipes sp.]|nr:TonB-dependent receptor [Alistipes sp.]
MKKSIFILFISLCPATIWAQSLNGRVVAADTGSALPGASIFWHQTTSGTTSGADGRFTLPRSEQTSILTVEFLGYAPQQIEVSSEMNDITIEMTPGDEISIDAVTIETRQRGNYAKQSGITRNEQISFAGLCKMACCNLAESFENSASVTVGYSDAISGARQIKMLGLAGTYTQILDENRPVMQGSGASYGLSYTPGMWLNSIQVSKGVASVTAGHEAITGQINLEHRKPTDDERLFLNLYFDSELRPEINLSTAFPLTADKRLSTVILAHGSMDTRRYDDNHDGFVDIPKANQINLANKWLYQTTGGTQIRWGWKVVNEERTGGQMDYRNSMREQMWQSVASATPIYGSKIRNRDINAYLKVGIPIGEEQAFGGDESEAVQNNLAMIFDYDNYSTDSYFGINDAEVSENALSFNLMYAHYFSKRSSVNVGASAHVRMLDNDYFTRTLTDGAITDAWSLTGSSTLSEPGIYAEYTYSIKDKFSLVVGMRADYSTVGGDYYIKNLDDRVLFTPRSHLRWSITPRTTLRASAGMGYRRVNLITDNIWVMTTSRTIRLADDLLNGGDDMESAITFGGSLSQTFRLAGDDQATISFDYFRSQFFNTMVFDQENASNEILIYNSKDRSYTDNYQIDFNWTPLRGLDIFATFRYTNSRITLTRGSEKIGVERPLTSRYKGLLNVQYSVRRWTFDATAQYNGPMRLPSLDGNLAEERLSPSYPMFYAQVSYRASNLTLYAGCENIGNYMQMDPILGASAPYSPGFNSSVVWGPLMGRKFYIGLRLNIY